MKEWKGRKTTNIAAAAAYLVSQASGIKKTVKGTLVLKIESDMKLFIIN